MSSALQLFVSECSERLDRLESALLALERNSAGPAELEAMFRDAHTIKGNAGVIQSGEIEWFAHILESVLERLYSGALPQDAALVSVLLPCIDHLRFLVTLVAMPDPTASALADEERARLIGLLVPYLHDGAGHPASADIQAKRSYWAITVSFGPGVLLQGLDPLYFLQHLQSIGRIVSLRTDLGGLPPCEIYDPERCYLRFEILLDSRADKQAIEDVFALVHDACELRITAPADKNQDFIRLIHSLPAEDLQVGEILLRIGALTADELASGLRDQRRLEEHHQADAAIGRVLAQEGFVEAGVIDAALQRQAEIRQNLSREDRLLRVPAEQIETLEQGLATTRHGMERLVRESAAGPEAVLARQLPALLAQLDSALGVIRSMRQVRLDDVFQGLHRLVRDTSQTLGKPADLVVTGGDIHVGPEIGYSLRDPLIHLVRNALDHGLEAPAQRLAAGKPMRGLVSIDAWIDRRDLVVRLADDGAGIDRERVLATARDRGLLAEDAEIEGDALLALLFVPGFSTARQLSRLSGRGIGLDAVRDRIEALGGHIHLQSLPARGTRFELRLPLHPDKQGLEHPVLAQRHG